MCVSIEGDFHTIITILHVRVHMYQLRVASISLLPYYMYMLAICGNLTTLTGLESDSARFHKNLDIEMYHFVYSIQF